jgi:acetoin utilization protein AcuC
MTLKSPLIYGAEIFASVRRGSRHPLAIPRVSLAHELIEALGWCRVGQYREARPASVSDLTRFHLRAYVDAVQDAERTGSASEAVQRRFNLGVNGNPVSGEVFRRPATACGGTIDAARQIKDGGVAFNPAGGTHHGQRDRASGYCIFNDPVLGILRLLDDGCERVFYLDLDAHFGDGVQDAFADDDRVFTLSIHEDGRWPMVLNGGGRTERGSAGDVGGGAACNLPVPAGFNDTELAFVVESIVLPKIRSFGPDALVLQCGCDALADDPMTKLALSNGALWDAVASVRGCAPRMLVLGGGGYNPYAVGRCWAGLWAVLNDLDPRTELDPPVRAVLERVRWTHRLGRSPCPAWFRSLADAPRPGPVRPAVADLAGGR